MASEKHRTDRARMRKVMDDLILHLHPPRVNGRSLRFSYTFGLGGAAILLLTVLVATGIMLMFTYRPTLEEAYPSIVELQTQIWFGQLIRNMHHWSGNLLLIVVGLHLLRVFYTGAFRKPRQLNWELGLGLLGLTIAANFTGYLLPWDQLSYWAVTVGTSMLSYIPIIGEDLRILLLGGHEVGESTLTNFYALHVMIIPLGFLVFNMYHIWRVRKDKFSTPRYVDEAEMPPSEMVTTLPHLVLREAVFALVLLVFLLAWASVFDAPLLQAADPNHPPDPTKAAWYFAGVQELLVYFHPAIGVFVIPVLFIGGLIILPYLPEDEDKTGIWFRSVRGRWLVCISMLIGIVGTIGLVWVSLSVNLPGNQSFLPELPLIIILIALYAYYQALKRMNIPSGERYMGLFTVLIAAFLVLTVIGALLRGPGMTLS